MRTKKAGFLQRKRNFAACNSLKKGPSVENFRGIFCDYRMLYVQHNYAFYRIEEDAVRITDIFHEREDFMWKLFGVKTTTQETRDYWRE